MARRKTPVSSKSLRAESSRSQTRTGSADHGASGRAADESLSTHRRSKVNGASRRTATSSARSDGLTPTKSSTQRAVIAESLTVSRNEGSTRSRRSRAPDNSNPPIASAARLSRSIGAPDSYVEVSNYFATVSDRARALGVQRHTIRKWDEALALRVRKESQDRVRVLVSTAQDVRQLIGDPLAAGRWLLTQQPVLRGVTPADLLLKLGDQAREAVRQLVTGVNPVHDRDIPDTDAFWRALEGKLSAADSAEVRRSVERARERGVSGALSL